MFLGFNLSNVTFNGASAELKRIGQTINASHQTVVRDVLDNFMLTNHKIDGSMLQGHWFPQIEADVFISHSHRDDPEVQFFAGWLKKEFDLESFIDSSIWGYSEDLLKQIDDKYCINPGGETYDYAKRNGSTSHVHMMLSTALGMMIDNTECLFFYNTPNALTSQGAVAKTVSPWIYSEIATTHIVRRKPPEAHRSMKKFAGDIQLQKLLHERLSIEYKVDMTSLIDITGSTLTQWQSTYSGRDSHPLDVLYGITT